MKVLDLFCGLKGWSDPFAELGHQVVTSDIEERFGPTIVSDIMDLTAQQVLDAFGGHPPDIILASPPCEKFSVATIGRNWNHDHTPKTDGAREAKVLVQKTLELITQLGGGPLLGTRKPSSDAAENAVHGPVSAHHRDVLPVRRVAHETDGPMGLLAARV